MNIGRKLSMALVLAALCAIPAVSHAGDTYESFSCGSNSCWGTFLGARDSTTSSDFVWFQQVSSASGARNTFYATYAGTQHSCVAPTTGPIAAEWPQATLAQGYFYIAWDAYGNCNSLGLTNGSPYSTF